MCILRDEWMGGCADEWTGERIQASFSTLSARNTTLALLLLAIFTTRNNKNITSFTDPDGAFNHQMTCSNSTPSSHR